ncbi:hypothetical protein [Sanguibacter sp. Z1732]|uniref:hypothetical protein n=1 Tax=Sanguibacter sp. Z1732 TaxID=3435412 RepID=UPI003D9CAD92
MWRRRTAVVGLAGLSIIVLVAITAPWIVPHPPGRPTWPTSWPRRCGPVAM